MACLEGRACRCPETAAKFVVAFTLVAVLAVVFKQVEATETGGTHEGALDG
jgi:hypothetical protein